MNKQEKEDIKEELNGENFTEKEKIEGRENGFLLGGKTGAGKSTLLNVLLNKVIAKVERNMKSVTDKVTFYYHKLFNNKMITIIDSPGLYDVRNNNNKNMDNIHLKEIRELVARYQIQIKGILFLVNFQNERFDFSEQEALINYNKIFPLPKFWDYILIIFTHHFGDPDGDTAEEMKEARDISNQEIFADIMKSVKEVSIVIDYKNLKTKFFNSYCPVTKDKQKIKNEKNKKELENTLNEFIYKEPLFTKIEIETVRNVVFKENGKNYKADIITIGYFDLKEDRPIKEDKYYDNKEEISEKDIKNTKIERKVDIFDAKRNSNGQIEGNHTKGTANNSYYMRKALTTGFGALIGVVAVGGILFLTPLSGLALVGAAGGGLIGGAIGYIKNK